MIEFTVPYPPTKRGKTAWCKRFGLNAYYAGKHWAQRKKDAECIHELTLLSLRKARVRRSTSPVPVAVTFFWDDGLDVDNHAVLGKMMLDACKGWLIKDDDRRYVRRVSHDFWDGGAIRVRVEEVAPDAP